MLVWNLSDPRHGSGLHRASPTLWLSFRLSPNSATTAIGPAATSLIRAGSGSAVFARSTSTARPGGPNGSWSTSPTTRRASCRWRTPRSSPSTIRVAHTRRRSAARPASAPSRASTSPRSAGSTTTTASATRPRSRRAGCRPWTSRRRRGVTPRRPEDAAGRRSDASGRAAAPEELASAEHHERARGERAAPDHARSTSRSPTARARSRGPARRPVPPPRGRRWSRRRRAGEAVPARDGENLCAPRADRQRARARTCPRAAAPPRRRPAARSGRGHGASSKSSSRKAGLIPASRSPPCCRWSCGTSIIRRLQPLRPTPISDLRRPSIMGRWISRSLPDSVVVVAGVPGAGKTTLLRRAVDRRVARVVDTDDRARRGPLLYPGPLRADPGGGRRPPARS